MDPRQFEKLDQICLLIDILIDCEDYNYFDEQLKNLPDPYLMQFFGNRITDSRLDTIDNIKNTIDEIIEEIGQKKDAYEYNYYFMTILISKYARRILKEKENKLPSKISKTIYKKLTEKLLKQIPIKSDKKCDIINSDNRFRIIFLNEISACSEGHLALGYAEMALEELSGLDKNWNLIKDDSQKKIRHPYELYALYNKGLNYLHDKKDTDKAIVTLKQITSLFEQSDRINKAGINEANKSFQEEYKELSNINELYPIYFWLFYVPSEYLIAEAYSDSSSSYNLENTIKDGVLKTIKKEIIRKNVILHERPSGKADDELTIKINDYYLVKFNIQLIFSAIDKQVECIFSRDIGPIGDWLENFKDIFNKNDLLNITKHSSEHSILKNRLDSAKVHFFLEHDRVSKEKNNETLVKAFKICEEHIKEELDPDWSDFASIFLECAIFKLEKDGLPLPESFDEYYEYYKKIFNKIINPEWIPRKKELVENFLICQEKLIRHFNEKIYINSGNKYLQFQIELIHNIYKEESERSFKKKWPICEKEKLVKNLKEIIKRLDFKDISDWWKKIKSKFENKNAEWSKNFEMEVIPKIQKMLSDDIYKLPDDVDQVAKFIHENMNCDFYTKKLRMNTEQFNDHLIYQSCRPSMQECYGLTVLRRWQSYTPALSMGSEVGHKGGGYFVYKTNEKGEISEGLVIDPGFDFRENFFDQGFSIRDIDAILMTHSHPDHTCDFMSILTLVHEMNKRGKRVFENGKWVEKKPIIFLTEGCHQHFAEQIFRSKDDIREIIRVSKNTPPLDKILKHFQLEVTKANHDDQSDHDSVGYIIKYNNGTPLIGFTGDTQWYHNIERQYEKCPVLCMNLGGVVDIFKEGNIRLSDLCDKDKEKHIKNIKTLLLRENHLYLPGFYLMAKKLINKDFFFSKKLKLLILSELPEEMKGGLRTDLAKKMSSELGIPVLPEDIGLTVKLDRLQKGYVSCKVCNHFISPINIEPVETDKDNAIVYLCRDHYNKIKEGSILPKIHELELDIHEIRKPFVESK